MADPVVPDPYGIDIAQTLTGDVAVTPSGAIATISGPENCVQALRARMLTLPDELPLHPDYGSDFPSKVGGKMNPTVLRGEAAVDVRRLTEQDHRFLGGQNITAEEVDGRPTAVKVGVELVLSAGDTIDVADLAAPALDEPVALADADLLDLVSTGEFDDFDALTLDEDEATELRDADLLDDLVNADSDPEAF